MTKYLRDQPFQVGGSTESYREGWDRIFGKKCEVCDGTGVRDIELRPCTTNPVTVIRQRCEPCGGTGKQS